MNRYEVDVRVPAQYEKCLTEAVALDNIRNSTIKEARNTDTVYQDALNEQRQRQEREIVVENE